MGMTLSMDPDTRNAVVGKIVEQGQAYRAVRPCTGDEKKTERPAPQLLKLQYSGRHGAACGYAAACGCCWDPSVFNTVVLKVWRRSMFPYALSIGHHT